MTVWSLIVVVLMIDLILILLYLFWPAWRPQLRFSASVLAATAALATGLVAITTAQTSLEVREAQLWHDKAITALDFAHRWDAATLRARSVLDQLRQFDSHDKKIKFLERDRTRREVVWNALNFLETLSVAVQFGLVDESMCRAWFARAVVSYWEETREFVADWNKYYDRAGLFNDAKYLYELWKPLQGQGHNVSAQTPQARMLSQSSRRMLQPTQVNIIGLALGVISAVLLYFGSRALPLEIESWKHETAAEQAFFRRRRHFATAGFFLLAGAFICQGISLFL